MDDHEATALPAAVVFAAIAGTALFSGIVDDGYPVDIRLFLTVFAVGFLSTGLVLWRSPRRLTLKNLRVPALATATGLIGIALNMPAENDWQLDAPFVDTPVADVFMVVGFLTAAVGYLMIVAATFVSSPRRLVVVGGLGAVAGSICFGTGLLVWGAAAATVDLQLSASAITAGLSGYSLAHVLPRVRMLLLD
jgi:hypothetical protein